MCRIDKRCLSRRSVREKSPGSVRDRGMALAHVQCFVQPAAIRVAPELKGHEVATRARASPILHSLFNPARDAFVFTFDFLHCALQSGILHLPAFDANFLGVESPKIRIVPKRAHPLAPRFTRPPYRRKPSNMRPACGGYDTPPNEKTPPLSGGVPSSGCS
jgi:hypothetical protein